VDAAGRKHCLPVFRERRAWRGAVLGAGDRRVRGAVRPAAGRAAGAERRIFPVPPLPAAGTRLWSGGGAMTAFDRDTVRSFRFVRCEFDAGSGIARLVYAFDDGPELVETITVPGAPFELDAARAAAAEQALRLLHLIAGVSYYKAAVPGDIRIDSYAIDAETAALQEEVYLNE